jgi:hypothetical protein
VSSPGERGQSGAAETRAKPAEISSDVWQRLSPPTRDAIGAMFARPTTTQPTKNSIARLAGLDVAEDATQDILALAGKLPPTVLDALVDIAERAPSALGRAVALAGQNRASAFEAVRKIRDIAAKPQAEEAAHNHTRLAAAPGQPTVNRPENRPENGTGRTGDGTGRTGGVDAIARSTMRAADRFAGMRSVTPPSGDSRTYQVTDADGTTFAVTVETAGDGPAAYTITGQNSVRITVSSHAAPAAVPVLVAGALAEAAAELSGHCGRTDFLVENGSGDGVLSVRDRGRAARLLAYDQVLRQSPLRFSVRARLTALIREMGLEPGMDGAADRLAALPDERMRDVVARHTDTLDGPLGTLAYLAKSVLPSIPVPVFLAILVGATPLIGGTTVAAIAITSLTKAVVQGVIDRSVAVREDAASGEQLGPRKRELRDQRMADLGSGFLRVMAAVIHGVDTGRAITPSGEATGLDVVTLQLARLYGMRRYTGALTSTAVLGALLLLTPLAPLTAAGIVAGTVAPAAVGTFADAARKRYTMSVKAARTNELLSGMNDLVSGHRASFADQVRTHLTATVDGRRFAYGDDAVGQLARALVPQSREAVAKDRDPTALAEFLHLSAEYGVFRVTNAAVTVGVNLLTGGRQHDAEQAAGFALKEHDLRREGQLDTQVLAAAVAEFVNLTATAPADTPLRDDPGRPSGLPPRKWMAVGVGAALLAVGVAFGAEAVLGIGGATLLAAGGLGSSLAEAGAGRKMAVEELKKADRKAERDRVAAQGERTTLAEALATFGRDLRDGPPPRTATGDTLTDRVLAARDRAYRQLVDEVRQSLTTPEKVSTTFVQRVVALHDVAAKAGKLAEVRTAGHGQARQEVVARTKLIAAIQKYNDIAPGVTTLPPARLFDGVHAGNAEPDRVPDLPKHANGQVAAVMVDRHLRDPDTPCRPPADLAALSGNEGWATRLAAAAGVPDGQFRPVAAFNDVVAHLRLLGPGSRAIVHAQRKNHYSEGAASGDLVNAVNIDGEVFLIDGTTGALADVTGYGDGLTVLITNGEQAPGSVRARVAGAYQNHVAGSLLTDPAAPGLPPGLPKATALRGGLARVINPVLGNDMPSIHAFSDQWDHDEERPEPPPMDPAAGLGVAMAVAGMAAALLETFADPAGMPEFGALTGLLRRDDVPAAELLDAMTALMEALFDHMSLQPA